jgi:uncharacterized phiE125 gp8 family phage protein
VSDVKRNAQIDHDQDDALLLSVDGKDGIVARATDFVEEYSGLAFITQTRRVVIDGGFPAESIIELPCPPLQSVEEIGYLDSDYAEQTVDTSIYRVLTNGIGRVAAKSAYGWPSAVDDAESVWLDITCGFGDAATDVPARWRGAIAAFATYLYEHRMAGEYKDGDRMMRALTRILDLAGAEARYV